MSVCTDEKHASEHAQRKRGHETGGIHAPPLSCDPSDAKTHY